MIIRELVVDSVMSGCHNTSFFPQGTLHCQFLTPLVDTKIAASNCVHGPTLQSTIFKSGSIRAWNGTSLAQRSHDSQMQRG